MNFLCTPTFTYKIKQTITIRKMEMKIIKKIIRKWKNLKNANTYCEVKNLCDNNQEKIDFTLILL